MWPKYIVDPTLPQLPTSPFGIASGSEEEGCYHATHFGVLWRANNQAMRILSEEAASHIANGWGIPN
jgi:hypothetical protein